MSIPFDSESLSFVERLSECYLVKPKLYNSVSHMCLKGVDIVRTREQNENRSFIVQWVLWRHK